MENEGRRVGYGDFPEEIGSPEVKIPRVMEISPPFIPPGQPLVGNDELL